MQGAPEPPSFSLNELRLIKHLYADIKCEMNDPSYMRKLCHDQDFEDPLSDRRIVLGVEFAAYA